MVEENDQEQLSNSAAPIYEEIGLAEAIHKQAMGFH